MKKGATHSAEAKRKMSEAHKGKTRKPFTEEHKQKMSEVMKGRPSPHRGKILSEKTKQKMSEAHKGKPHTADMKRKMSEVMKGKPKSEEHKRKQSKALKGRPSPKKGKPTKPPSEKTRQKMSAGHQGIPYDEWCEFAKDQRYCPKFNEACRESCRAKYNHRCFMCNKTEKANGQRLSVHHVDMDKAQGCKSNWKLVPLCRLCHNKAHNDEIIARLGYILKR